MRFQIVASLVLLLALLCAQDASAQDLATGVPSEPGGNGQAQTGSQEQSPYQNSANQENAVSLSGIRAYTPGSVGEARSFILPSFRFFGSSDSNPYYRPNGSSEEFYGTVAWGLALQRIKRRSQLNLTYEGGEIMSPRPLSSAFGTNLGKYQSFHSLKLSDEYDGLRWKTILMDQFALLPESSFSFPGSGGLAGFGAGLGNPYSTASLLNNTLVPNQTILTGYTRRISNSSAAEVDYSFTPRTSISMSGTYGILHNFSSGFINTNFYVASAGYNHLLTRQDQLGVSYAYENISFSGLNYGIETHYPQISYGRKITGKLSMKLSVGPMLDVINRPVGGPLTKTFVSTDDSLQYLLRGGGLHLVYDRYTSAGAGVLLGAETDLVNAGVSHRLLRGFYGSLDAGYARNESLSGVGVVIKASNFNTVEGRATIGHEIGEHMSFFVGYQLQRQDLNAPVCIAGQCGKSFLRNTGSVGINWRGPAIGIH